MSMSRRLILSAGAAGGLATLAGAQAEPAPQPDAGNLGGTDPGPRDPVRDGENPDLLNPPVTDNGSLPNLRWSFADSHMRRTDGGWTRQTTVRELGVSKSIAGVNMRLNRGGTREMHWHKAAEWAFMLNGRARITAIDAAGRNFADDVAEGDLWYFPAGIPHSIQGLDPDGCEFLLVFDDGSFSEDNTFLITDWFDHVPPEVLAKNFGVPASAFAHLPAEAARYIFPLPVPGPLATDRVADARGTDSFSFRTADVTPIATRSGRVRIVDSTNFPASKAIAAAIVEVEPGGLRELHWHPNADEWQYYISGEARMGVFGSSADARTFDYRAGDVGFVPYAMGHYIENTGSTTLRFLEMFRASSFQDISLNQWMALTPPELVRGHLGLPDSVMAALNKTKNPVVPA